MVEPSHTCAHDRLKSRQRFKKSFVFACPRLCVFNFNLSHFWATLWKRAEENRLTVCLTVYKRECFWHTFPRMGSGWVCFIKRKIWQSLNGALEHLNTGNIRLNLSTLFNHINADKGYKPSSDYCYNLLSVVMKLSFCGFSYLHALSVPFVWSKNKFSSLLSKHFLMVLIGRIFLRSQQFLFGAHALDSHYLLS